MVRTSENTSGVSNMRTGKNLWVKHDYDKTIKNIGEKLAKVVNLPLANAETFQVIYYDKNQEYKQHYDTIYDDKHIKYGGVRLITALCYLNTVEIGGGTEFPKLNITIPAEKGKLLIFQNTISINNNKRHVLSLHAGLPVQLGEKYAFNLWFRECSRKVLYKDYNPDYYKNK